MASGRLIEIRVHGVSGTPPHSMLGVAPSGVVPETSSGVEDVWRREGGDDGVRAFGWSNLTSGPPRTAWWILLLPYMLVNLAGWAGPPGTGIRVRAFESALRLTGLAVTMIFALVAGIGLIEIGGVAILNGELGVPLPTSLVIGAAATVALVTVLWVAASRGDVEQRATSDRPYLRPLHTTVAIWCVWWLLELFAAERGLSALIGFSATVLVVPAAAAAVTVVTTLWEAPDRPAGVAGHTLLWMTVTGLGVDAVALFADAAPAATFRARPLVSTIVAFAVLATASVALGWSRRSPETGPAIATLLALAGSMGTSVGAASLWVATLPFPMIVSEPVVQIAKTFTTGVAGVAAVFGLLVAGSADSSDPAAASGWLAAVRVRDRAGILLWVAPAVTTLMAVLTMADVAAGTPATWPAPASAVLAVVASAGLVTGLVRMRMRRAAATVAGVTAAAVLAVGATGLTFTAVAVGVSLLVPLSFVLVRLHGGLTDRESRRALAVPWDVGSYFGRRFHPFAPPGYRDRAVAGLVRLVGHHRSRGDIVVLGGHSQGSVIAAAALGRLDAGTGTAFLTYGSPLRPLYARFFPASFGDEVFRGLTARVDGNWVNIWRATDPVAAPIAVDGVRDERWEDAEGIGHDGYWLTDRFAAVVRELGARAGSPPSEQPPGENDGVSRRSGTPGTPSP